MSFPTSPSDGQLYTTALGTQYSYVAADTAWKITGGPGGGGTIKGSGTANVVAKWTDSSTIGDSIISADSTGVLVNASNLDAGYGSNGRTNAEIRGCLFIDASSELVTDSQSALGVVSTGGIWSGFFKGDNRGGDPESPNQGGGLIALALGNHTSGECYAIKTIIPDTSPAWQGDVFIGGSLNAYTDVNIGVNEDQAPNFTGTLNVNGKSLIDYPNQGTAPYNYGDNALTIKNEIPSPLPPGAHSNYGGFALYVEETLPDGYTGDNYLGGPNFLGDTTINSDYWGDFEYDKNLQVNGRIWAGDPSTSPKGQLIINGGTTDNPTMGQLGIDATGMAGDYELAILQSTGDGGNNSTLTVINDTHDVGSNTRGHAIYARTVSSLSQGIENHVSDTGYALYTDGDIGIRGVINTIEGKYYKDYLPITQTVMDIPVDQTGIAAVTSEDNSVGGSDKGFGIPRTVNSTFLLQNGDRIKLASCLPYNTQWPTAGGGQFNAHYSMVGNGEIYVYDSSGMIADYATFSVLSPNSGDPYTSTGTHFIDRLPPGTAPYQILTEDEYNKGYFPTHDSMILEVEGNGDSVDDPTMSLILECYSPNAINYVVGISFKYFNIPSEIAGA